MSLNYNLFKKLKGQLTVTEAAKKYGIQNRTTVVQWLRKFVTLIGKIKHHLLCQSHQNRR
jgi:phage antirepressor YoqD-like protein